MTYTSRLAEILALPPEQRLELAAAIWESLAEDTGAVPVPAWHEEIITERLREDEETDTPSLLWPETRRRIEKGS